MFGVPAEVHTNLQFITFLTTRITPYLVRLKAIAVRNRTRVKHLDVLGDFLFGVYLSILVESSTLRAATQTLRTQINLDHCHNSWWHPGLVFLVFAVKLPQLVLITRYSPFSHHSLRSLYLETRRKLPQIITLVNITDCETLILPYIRQIQFIVNYRYSPLRNRTTLWILLELAQIIIILSYLLSD